MAHTTSSGFPSLCGGDGAPSQPHGGACRVLASTARLQGGRRGPPRGAAWPDPGAQLGSQGCPAYEGASTKCCQAAGSATDPAVLPERPWVQRHGALGSGESLWRGLWSLSPWTEPGRAATPLAGAEEEQPEPPLRVGVHVPRSSQGWTSPSTAAERRAARPARPRGSRGQGGVVTGGNVCSEPLCSGDSMGLVQPPGNGCSGCWNRAQVSPPHPLLRLLQGNLYLPLTCITGATRPGAAADTERFVWPGTAPRPHGGPGQPPPG